MKKTAAFVFLCLVWGSTWLAIKISIEGIPPFLGAAARFMIAFTAVAFIALAKKVNLKIGVSTFKILAVTSLLVYALDYGLIYWAEQYLSAGVTAIFFATFPLFTVVFSNFVFKSERFSWRTFFGVALGFAGILTVFLDQLLVTRFGLKVIVASLAVIVAAAAASMSAVLVKKYLSDLNRYALTFHQMGMGVLFLFALGFLVDSPADVHLSTKVCAAVVYLGFVGSAVAFICFYWLLERMSAISLSLMNYVIPVVALALDFAVFEEVISIRAGAGIALVFGGIWISQVPQRKAASIAVRP